LWISPDSSSSSSKSPKLGSPLWRGGVNSGGEVPLGGVGTDGARGAVDGGGVGGIADGELSWVDGRKWLRRQTTLKEMGPKSESSRLP
jgi:hypothetical protein